MNYPRKFFSRLLPLLWSGCLPIIILNLYILDAHSQTGYIIGENYKKSGIQLIDGGKKGNAQRIKVDYKDSIITYSPSTIVGYGFEKGNRYKSKTILLTGEVKTVFLEELVAGETHLFYYPDKQGKVFFLQQDSGNLIPVRKGYKSNNTYFKGELAKYTSHCPGYERLLGTTNFTKGSLAMFINALNNGCDKKYIPFIKYGLFIDAGKARLKVASSNVLLNDLVFDPQDVAAFGVFLNYPLWPTYFSSYNEVYLEHTTFSSSQLTNDGLVTIDINCTSLNIPMLIRYTVPSRTFRPFLNTGFMFSWNFNVQSADLKRPFFSIPVENDIYSIRQFSLLGGAGFEIAITPRNAISLECRYSWGVNTNKTKFFKDEWKMIVGFNF